MELENYRRKDSSLTYELQTKVTSYEQKVEMISRESESLRRNLNEQQVIIHNYEIKIQQFSKEG